MARVCSRRGCVMVPDRKPAAAAPVAPPPPPQQFRTGTPLAPGESAPSFDQAMENNRLGQVRNARYYIENNQPLTPQMQPFEAEARAQIEAERAANPGFLSQLWNGPKQVMPQQNQTLAQRMQSFGGGSSFDPIEKYYTENFKKNTVPYLANQFTGNKESSAFQGALGSAASDLNTNLGLLRSQYDMALRDQMIKMAALNPQQGQQAQQPSLRGGIANLAGAVIPEVLAQAAQTFIPGVGGLAATGIRGIGNYLSNRAANNQQVSYPAQVSPTERDYLSNIQGRIGQGGTPNPSDIQRFQAITGLGGSAATDFANTFQQPGSQQSMMGQNLDKFKKFTRANPTQSLQYLGLRS